MALQVDCCRVGLGFVPVKSQTTFYKFSLRSNGADKAVANRHTLITERTVCLCKTRGKGSMSVPRWAGAVLCLVYAACGGPQNAPQALVQPHKANEPSVKLSLSQFVLGPGDELTVVVFRNPDMTRKVKVMPDGTFSYPFLGELKAAGVGVTDLRQKITQALSKYFVDPQVSIEITALKSRKVFVLGEVKQPGVFLLEGPTSAIEAISKAGGFTQQATSRSVVLFRQDGGRAYATKLNVERALRKGEVAQNVALQPGDVLYIPTSFVTDVDRFMMHVSSIIAPLVFTEFGIVLGPTVKNVLEGSFTGSSNTTPAASISSH